MSEAKGALESFWSIFQSVCPEHGVFRKLRESKGRLSTSQLIPILVHGDEGTTYKRGGMLVLQFTGVIGQGSKKSETPRRMAQTYGLLWDSSEFDSERNDNEVSHVSLPKGQCWKSCMLLGTCSLYSLC